MDSQAFREAAMSSIEEIAGYFDNISDRPVVSTVNPGYLRDLLPSEVPEEGEAWSTIQDDIEAKTMPGITHWQHPNFHAFFPCATSYPSILGELYNAAISGACFNWINSPAVTELETIVLDWLAKLLTLPPCFSPPAQPTAAAEPTWLPSSPPPPIAEPPSAALILGIRLHIIPVNASSNYALTGPPLSQALADCRALHLEPLFLTATLGTTDTCAVDDLASIASVLSTYASDPETSDSVWVHVDAAYAGAALIYPEVQASISLASLAEFHSFDMNMHKWMLTNFDASCLYVRNRSWFTQALSVNQAVYSNSASSGGLVTDYREWQIPLGRQFRALKIWFVLRIYGKKGLQEYVMQTIALGERFATLLRRLGDYFEIVAPPRFALTVFKMLGDDEAEGNKRTRELYERVNRSGKMWVTGTVLEGRFAIQMVTSGRTTEWEHVNSALRIIKEAGEEILKEKEVLEE